MYIIGCKHNAKSVDAITAVKKHTGKSLLESKKLIESVMEGKSVKLPDDFVLREDLEDANFLIA
jgi:ribosomal protein L7/L12